MTIDPSFTTQQRDAIAAGLEEWRVSVPELQLAPSDSPCAAPSAHQVCIHPAFDAPDPADDVIGTTDPGSSGDATIWIYVDRIEATGWDVSSLTEQTAAHEIGHALGLKHSATGNLMAADVPDQAHTVTAADVSQFWAIRGR